MGHSSFVIPSFPHSTFFSFPRAPAYRGHSTQPTNHPSWMAMGNGPPQTRIRKQSKNTKMKTTLKTLVCAALCCAAASAFAAPGNETIAITAQSTAHGVNPSGSPKSKQWLYVICLPSGGTLSDTLPISCQGQNTSGDPGDSTTVSFTDTGDDLGITGTGSFMMSDTDDVTRNIVLNKSGLADGTYNANVQISVPPGDNFAVTHDSIRIQVVVGRCKVPQMTCWFTDSDYNNLFNCDMQEVTGDSGGTFQIVKNARGKVAATNPGQFYYNMLVPNTTGSDQTVTVDLSATGLSSHGAQAVHAASFDPDSGFPAETDWLYVNSSGAPCGPTGGCTMTIPEGQVLFVTWHLAFGSTGSQAPSVWNNICGAINNPSVSATGGVIPMAPSTLSGSCTANAAGYLKQ